MKTESPCNGCIHSKKYGCSNKNRIADLIRSVKSNMAEERYFTAAQILIAAGSMQMDFDRDGFTSYTMERSPKCYTFISADEDFNREAHTL